jgi:hypothetical protein
VGAPEAGARPNIAGAIYGQILATAVVAGLSEDGGISCGEIFAGVAVTSLVFWLAHVYAEGMARQLDRSRPLRRAEIRDVAAHEWPIVQAAAPVLVALGLGWAGAVSRDVSVDLAIGVGVAALAGWGFLIARRSGMSPLGTLGAVALNAAFGLAIVVLKVAVK